MIGSRGGKVYVDYLQNGHGKTIAGTVLARARSPARRARRRSSGAR